MPSNTYCPARHHQSSTMTLLSHYSEKLAKLPLPQLPQFVEEVQDGSTNLDVDHFLRDRTLTARSWAYKLKVSISLSKIAGAPSEQAINYVSPILPNSIHLATQQTYRRIAELGATNETFLYALEWLDRLREIAVNIQMWWREPLVNLSIDSEIVFEWWYENKKLTVYILDNTAEYVQVWGPDIDNQMQEGPATSSADLTSLWKWLVT